MKKFIIGLSLICVATFLIPAVMLPVSSFLQENSENEVPAITTGHLDALMNDIQTDNSYTVTLYRTSIHRTISVDFEDYIAGIIAVEMPPTHHIEALKAQAVAARSFILSKLTEYKENPPTEHQGALLCDHYAHCRAWCSLDEIKAQWDPRFADDYEKKIRQAVLETKGEYMTYEDQIVKAYFHAVSSGKTENIEDVWGVFLPYLRSVHSAKDTRADGYKSRVFYPKNAFLTVLHGLRPNFEINQDFTSLNCRIESNQTGSIKTIELLNETFTGREIQEAFHLRSPVFSVTYQDEQVIFDVKGCGHGVGMSQFGANTMALEGSHYKEILHHYYTNVIFSNLYQKA